MAGNQSTNIGVDKLVDAHNPSSTEPQPELSSILPQCPKTATTVVRVLTQRIHGCSLYNMVQRIPTHWYNVALIRISIKCGNQENRLKSHSYRNRTFVDFILFPLTIPSLSSEKLIFVAGNVIQQNNKKNLVCICVTMHIPYMHDYIFTLSKL